MKQTPTFAFTVILVACSPASAQPAFYGTGKAIDGDSLQVGDREVRLFGIDAPEFSQTCTRDGQAWDCGAEAADQLARLVTGKAVRCVPVNTDEHGRTVARCRVRGIEARGLDR